MGNLDLELKKPYLCRCASRGSVSNSPRCFLSGTELSLLKDLNEYWEDVGINHILTGEKKDASYGHMVQFQEIKSELKVNLGHVDKRKCKRIN